MNTQDNERMKSNDSITESLDTTSDFDLKIEAPMKSIVIVFSHHHRNTEKVAKVFSEVLEARIVTPEQIDLEELQEYSLIGFGSGIYSARHHKSLLDLVDKLPPVTDKKAFIFSTSAMLGESKVEKDHSILREKLQSKGYRIVDEFACKGFNTNSFLKYVGGMNKGRPNVEDLKHAEEFAQRLILSCNQQDVKA